MITEAIICLSLNIYFEAKSESEAGQVAVAQVVTKRTQHQADKTCSVIFKEKQFSWANPLLKDKIRRKEVAKKLLPKDKAKWDNAVKIARLELEGKLPRVVDATHFHSAFIHKPKTWGEDYVFVKKVGNHMFYNNVKYKFD